MKRFDWLALILCVFLLTLLAGVLLYDKFQPVKMTCGQPGQTQMGTRGFVAFQFSKAVDRSHFEALLNVEPKIDAELIWADDMHALWRAHSTLEPGLKVAFSFEKGRLGQDGGKLKAEACQFEVHRPLVAVLNDEGGSSNLYVLDPYGKDYPRQITNHEGTILGFSASPDGRRLVFSLTNEVGGADLWFVGRDSEASILLECKDDMCVSPAWSPDSLKIAYTRQSAALEPNSPKGAPRIWLYDLSLGKTAALLKERQHIGYGTQWSPDVKHLSTWDGSNGGMRVINLATQERVLVESGSGYLGTWSADSQKLYYSDMVLVEDEYLSVIKVFDIQKPNETEVILADSNHNANYRNPISNPAENRLALLEQANSFSPEGSIALFEPESGMLKKVHHKSQQIIGDVRWSPNGKDLIFMAFAMGEVKPLYEIWFFQEGAQEARKIGETFRQPTFMP